MDSQVVDEAIAAYTGSATSLRAALDVYKRNVFLEVSMFLKSEARIKCLFLNQVDASCHFLFLQQ